MKRATKIFIGIAILSWIVSLMEMAFSPIFDTIYNYTDDFYVSLDKINPDTGEKTFSISSLYWIGGDIVYSEYYHNISENKIDSIKTIHNDICLKFNNLRRKNK